MKFVAVDLGASGGRLMVGEWDGRRFALEELHRFANAGVQVPGGVDWDALRLWQEIQNGLMKFKAKYGGAPAGIAVDAWGVDFALLDKNGRLMGNPTCYRDPRTNGMPAKVFAKVSEAEIFRSTGVQTMQINTLFQLAAMEGEGDARLAGAETMLMMPDLFSYFLCGAKAVEYTEATTTQMYRLAGVEAHVAGAKAPMALGGLVAGTEVPAYLKRGGAGNHGDWDWELVRRVGIPERILPGVVQPGTMLGEISAEVLEACGLAGKIPVVAVASHDTASAVAAIPGLDDEPGGSRGSAFISSGTWSLMGVELDAPVTTERARELGFTNEGGCAGKTLLMRNMTGLWILQECMRQWEKEGKRYGWDELIAAAKAARPFGALIDPNAAEFGAPGNMPEVVREFCRRTGQAAPETVGEVARCCFESLSLAYRRTLEALRALTGPRIETLRVVGGGGLNTFLCQMTADACGCAVVSGPAEASALGNVMVQAVSVGELKDVAEGRERVGEGLQANGELVRYEPRRDGEWDEARKKFEVLVIRD